MRTYRSNHDRPVICADSSHSTKPYIQSSTDGKDHQHKQWNGAFQDQWIVRLRSNFWCCVIDPAHGHDDIASGRCPIKSPAP